MFQTWKLSELVSENDMFKATLHFLLQMRKARHWWKSYKSTYSIPGWWNLWFSQLLHTVLIEFLKKKRSLEGILWNCFVLKTSQEIIYFYSQQETFYQHNTVNWLVGCSVYIWVVYKIQYPALLLGDTARAGWTGEWCENLAQPKYITSHVNSIPLSPSKNHKTTCEFNVLLHFKIHDTC